MINKTRVDSPLADAFLVAVVDDDVVSQGRDSLAQVDREQGQPRGHRQVALLIFCLAETGLFIDLKLSSYSHVCQCIHPGLWTGIIE